MTTGEVQLPAIDEVAALSIAYHGIHEARAAISSSGSVDQRIGLTDHYVDIAVRIEELIKGRPGMLAELEDRELSTIERTVDTVAMLDAKRSKKVGERGSSLYRETQLEVIRDSGLVLAGLNDLRDTSTDSDAIRKGFNRRRETGEFIPGATIEVNIDGEMLINGKKPLLKPTQKVIINAIIDAEGVIAYSEIYDTPEFAAAIKEQGLSSPPVVCLRNNLDGLGPKLAKLQTPIESIVYDGGPKGSGLLERNPNLEVFDEAFTPKVSELASYIFDQTDIGEAFQPNHIALGFFEAKNLGGRQIQVVKQAVSELQKQLLGHGVRIFNDVDGSITLKEQSSKRETADEIVELDKLGDIKSIELDRVVYQKGEILLTSKEQRMLLLIMENRQQGVTRAHIKAQLTKGGHDVSEFELEFGLLRNKLDGLLVRRPHRGRTRYQIKSPKRR